MEESIGKWLAYPYIVQMLHGASTAEVSSLAKKHFKQTLVPYYFKSSLHMLNKLEENGVHNHIISASADIFVDAAAPTLALPLERFNGIKVKVKNGKLTEQLEYPVTWADGKTEKLRQIIADTASRNPGKKVVVLAAFGNSYSTDGAFMKYVATQKLPAGSPVTLMINGGTCPEEYRDLFTEVNQSETSNNIE